MQDWIGARPDAAAEAPKTGLRVAACPGAVCSLANIGGCSMAQALQANTSVKSARACHSAAWAMCRCRLVLA